MKRKTYILLTVLIFFSVILIAEPRGDAKTSIFMHDDNHDTTLPASYRSWYYKEFSGLPTNEPVQIHVKGDGWEGGKFVIPVYSYYGTKWHRFEKEDIFEPPSSNSKYNDYTISKQFDKQKVYIARFYPYDYKRLEKLEKRFSFKEYFRSQFIGRTGMRRELKMFTITDFSVPNEKKKAIWIHSRTHPSETGSSFVAEGLMEYILKDKTLEEIQISLRELVFYIVPMVNMDGVIEGNARVTPVTSIDLEREWLFSLEDSRKLLEEAALEAKVLNNTINRLIDEGNNFILAVNLHSTNSSEGTYPFIFTNFSRQLPEHGASGDSMFVYHMRYANLINNYLCGGRLNVITSYSPSKPMHLKTYPESWWWVNFKDKVVAFTLESAYTHPGCYEERVSYKDNLQLGEALAKAIQKYYEIYFLDMDNKDLYPYDNTEHMKYYIPHEE